jgi:hypothetical protein
MHKLRAGKDFWSGVMFTIFAAVGLYVARGYPMGTSGKMGPGYFPIVLAFLLGALGLLLIGRAILTGDSEVDHIRLRPLLLMVIGVVLFGVAIQPLGLVIALAIAIIFAAMAGRQSSVAEVGAMVIVLTAFSIGIFHYVLLLPLPILPNLKVW